MTTPAVERRKHPFRRSWGRTDYLAKIILVLTDNRVIRGHTLNVGLGGISIHVDDEVDKLREGLKGELSLDPDPYDMRFSCIVARAVERTVALRFIDEVNSFGLYI
ncbi:MAG TPA: PilZ domain-containing protein, partial [Magnetococcales bacterium]|nr:PilZ domain-containing protein [Magnetococcales bacterium]